MFDMPMLPFDCVPNAIAALVLPAVSAVSVVVGFTGVGVGLGAGVGLGGVGEGAGAGVGAGVGVGVGVGLEAGVDPLPAVADAGVDVKLEAAPPPQPVISTRQKIVHEQKQVREARLKSRLLKRSEVTDSSYSTH